MSPHPNLHVSERGGRDNSPTCAPKLPQKAVQQQLDVMSQAVLDMWATLRTVEAALSNAPTSCSPTIAPSAASPLGPKVAISGGADAQFVGRVGTHDIISVTSPNVVAAALDNNSLTPQPVGAGVRDINSLTSPGPPSSSAIRLAAVPQVGRPKSIGLQPQPHKSTSAGFDSSPPLLGSTLAEAGIVLIAAKRTLDSTPCVASTKVSTGAAGTIATLSVKMVRNSPPIDCSLAAAIAKSALLEAAVSSQSVYVLGYETIPFHDNGRGIGFSGTLAIVSCGSSTCWDTYQKGSCPRGSKCKWRHPGRDEVQPIRVVFH